MRFSAGFGSGWQRILPALVAEVLDMYTAGMALLRVCHNHVRPHMGLGGNMTPGEAAGISIPDRNKWVVLI